MSSLIPFDSDRWKLKGRESARRVSASGSKLVIVSGPKTDWWRTAIGSEPESGVNRTSGPLYYIEVPCSERHWQAGVWISGVFDERFKQATLFCGMGDYSEQAPWVKAGVEVEDGRHNVGCVVAAPYSDWAILPVTETIGSEAGQHKLYMQFTRANADVFVHYAIASTASEERPKNVQLLREIKGFAANSSDVTSDVRHLGVMVCGPLSEATEGQWDNFHLQYT